MLRIYVPNTSQQSVGGGWTFIRNLRKALQHKGQIVDNWQTADLILIMGVTVTKPSEIIEARKAGKKIAFRVDNVPKKSRNRNQTPYQRMKELALLSDIVIYQSKWAEWYCKPLTGEGTVIYNGVDTDLFKRDDDLRPNHNRYLFAYHGKSELKSFWTAHYLFQQIFRDDPNAEFWFINDFGRDTAELINSNFDFWNGEQYRYLPKQTNEKQMADVMKQCTHLIFPSVADASPNTVLEARASGLEIIGYPDATVSGTAELLEPNLEIGLDRMGEEYFGVLSILTQNV